MWRKHTKSFLPFLALGLLLGIPLQAHASSTVYDSGVVIRNNQTSDPITYNTTITRDGDQTTTASIDTDPTGAQSSSVLVVTKNPNGVLTEVTTQTSITGAVTVTQKTVVLNPDGSQTYTGQITEPNGTIYKITGQITPNATGNISSITYTNAAGATKTITSETIRVGNTVTTTSSGTDFNGKPITTTNSVTTIPNPPVGGQCGAAGGRSDSKSPTSGLCTAGIASAVSGPGPWQWSCIGSNGGLSASCSDKLMINGACGAANGASLTTAPTTSLCTAGNSSQVSGQGPWTWTCLGTNSGTTASCSAALAAPQSCTDASGTTHASGSTYSLKVSQSSGSTSASTTQCPYGGTQPTTTTVTQNYLCTNGSLSTQGAPVSLTTFSGSPSCNPAPINGLCGAANGATLSSTPKSNLCSTGNASAINGTGPWSWSCVGSNGGTTASCSASAPIPTSNWPAYCASTPGANGPALVSCFINFLGVNQHLGWIGSVYDNEPLELIELKYLGITHVRDAPAAYNTNDFIALAQSGIKFGGPIGSATNIEMSGAEIPNELAPYDVVEKAVPNSVYMVEGANETNTQNVFWQGVPTTNEAPLGPAAALAIQTALYANVKADPNLSGVPVVDTTVNPCCDPEYRVESPWWDYVAAEGNLDTVGKTGNFHVYNSAGPSYLSFQGGVQWAQKIAPNQPVYITEFGYVAPGWITEAQESYYLLDGIMNAYSFGVQNLFIYELMDGNTVGGDTMGLFHSDGTAKPAAVSIHNMMTILGATKDAGPLSPSHPLPTISGLSPTGHSLALVNGIGGYDILLWDEGSGSNAIVNLGAQYPVVTIYDPVKGLAPLGTLTNQTQTTIQVGTDPIILTLGTQ